MICVANPCLLRNGVEFVDENGGEARGAATKTAAKKRL